MVPSGFEQSNAVLDKPAGMTYDECEALSICTGTDAGGRPVIVSCWKLTREELEEVARTGRVWLVVLGKTMPPVLLEGVSPFPEAPHPG